MIRIVQAHRNLLYVRLRKIIIPEWMGRVRCWTASLQECLPCLTVGLNQSINRNIETALKGFDGSNRVRFAGRLRNFSINALSGPAEELVVFAPPFAKGVAQFPHPLGDCARFFPTGQQSH